MSEVGVIMQLTEGAAGDRNFNSVVKTNIETRPTGLAVVEIPKACISIHFYATHTFQSYYSLFPQSFVYFPIDYSSHDKNKLWKFPMMSRKGGRITFAQQTAASSIPVFVSG